MPAVPILCFLLLLGGCPGDERESPAPSASSAPPRQAAATAAPAAKPDDEPVITVDDTPEGAAEDGAEQGLGDGKDDGEEEPEGDCAPPGSDLKPMQLLRFAFASGIEGKDPKDELRVARPGERVYAHLTMRNRSGRARCLRLVFRVGGKKRTEVTLEIGKSWSWRTWAYNTIKPDDRGPLELTIEDDQGQLVLKKTLAVVAP